MVYVYVGGLRACAWTDLVWGSALIAGGAIVAFLAFGTLADKPAEELILTKVANSSVTVEELRSWIVNQASKSDVEVHERSLLKKKAAEDNQ